MAEEQRPPERPRVLLLGDDGATGRAIRAAAAEIDFVVPVEAEQGFRAELVLIALDGRASSASHLGRTRSAWEGARAHMVDGVVTVVVALAGPVPRLDVVLRRVVGPEIIRQLESLDPRTPHERARSIAVRVRQRILLILGIDVYRVSAIAPPRR